MDAHETWTPGEMMGHGSNKDPLKCWRKPEQRVKYRNIKKKSLSLTFSQIVQVIIHGS